MSRKPSSRDGTRDGVEGAQVVPLRPRIADLAVPEGAPDYVDALFELREDGRVWRKAKDGSGRATWVFNAIEVLALARDISNGRWQLQVAFRDPDGNDHRELIAKDAVVGDCTEVRRKLAASGFEIHPSRAAGEALGEFLTAASPARRTRLAPRPGWHEINGRSVLVTPSETFGAFEEDWILADAEGAETAYTVAGTAEEWRDQIGRLCVGNSRLTFAASAAFAPVLLHLLGIDGGGFNLVGASSVGKSTALFVAASVIGGSKLKGAEGAVRSWYATGVGLENVGLAHCDSLLCLDELGFVQPREAGSIAYLLSNGVGRIRGLRTSDGLRPAIRFRLLFLSSGEIGIADKIAEAGMAVRGGQEVRCVDIPADARFGHGLFENLHTHENGNELAKHLREQTGRVHGGPLAPFLRHVVARSQADPETFATSIRGRIDDLVSTWLDGRRDASGQVYRVATRFALVAAAGEIATRLGLTGWPADGPSWAASACFEAWLEARGTVGAREDADAIIALRNFISRHAVSRLDVWAEEPARHADDPPEHGPPGERFRIMNRAGWRRFERDDRGKSGWTYFILTEAMREALTGLNFRAAVATLAAAGLLIPGSDGRSSRSERPPHHQSVRVYVVPARILEIDDGAGDA